MGFLEMSAVSKAFGPVRVLHSISLAVEEGEFIVLVGPSGCGKSTLLNLVAGLEPLGSGTISMGGARIDPLPPAERNIAMVFQSYALYPNMTVRENLGFGLEMRGVPRAARREAIAEAAALLQIDALLDRKPAQLSGGQRQRVAMGRALVRKPRLFLFDEPLSNLDARLRIEMRTLIKRLHQEFHTTTLYVTHDQVEAMTLATRIAVMREGRLQQVGAPQEVYARPANLFVAGFMGSPAMNLIPAALVRAENGAAVHIALTCGRHATLALPSRTRLDTIPAGDVVLGLRPEAIAEAAPGDAGDVGQHVELRVDVVEPTGSDTFVVGRLGSVDVVARLRADAEPRAGETLRLAVDMGRAVLFDPITERRMDPDGAPAALPGEGEARCDAESS